MAYNALLVKFWAKMLPELCTGYNRWLFYETPHQFWDWRKKKKKVNLIQNLIIDLLKYGRWDSQRVRERRQVEHLKQVMNSSNLNQKKKLKLKSFISDNSKS